MYDLDDNIEATEAVEEHLARLDGEPWGMVFSSSASSSYLEGKIFRFFMGDDDGKDMMMVENEKRFSLALRLPKRHKRTGARDRVDWYDAT